eukprot:COSAG05_NODE_573_length_8601_cov_58.330981_2_plen_88_part_00
MKELVPQAVSRPHLADLPQVGLDHHAWYFVPVPDPRKNSEIKIAVISRGYRVNASHPKISTQTMHRVVRFGRIKRGCQILSTWIGFV